MKKLGLFAANVQIAYACPVISNVIVFTSVKQALSLNESIKLITNFIKSLSLIFIHKFQLFMGVALALFSA